MVRRYRVVLVLLGLFLLFLPSLGRAQRSIGVIWEPPDSQLKAKKQLHRFSEAGFAYLQIEGALTRATWKTIDRLGFKVYASLPVQFPVKGTFRSADSTFYHQMAALAKHYQSQPSVQAIGLFSYGQIDNATFRKKTAHFIKRIGLKNTANLYYLTTKTQPTPIGRLVNFKIVSVSQLQNTASSNVGAWVYRPPDGKTWKLQPVKQFLKATSHSPDIPILFSSEWLQIMSQKHPRLGSILSLYATSSSAVFPLPQHNISAVKSHNIIVIALLIVWLLFGIAFRYDLLFQSSFYRYFFSHKFYVGDVVNRKIRTFFSGYSILIQHCLAGGIIYYCALQTIFSNLGQKALFFHLPALAVFGTSHIELFLWGLVAVLIIETISVLLLFITNTDISHISQAINLYCWPLQLNSLIATIAVIFFLIGNWVIPIYVTTCLFLLIFFGSFAVTAKDMVSYLRSKRLWLFSGFAMLYFVVLFGFIGWLYYSTAFTNVIQLSLSLF